MWQARWPKVYDRYLAVLREYYPEPQGVREFVRILGLHRTFSESQVAAALEWALGARCYTWEGVLHWLRAETGTTSTLDAELALAATAPSTPHVALPNVAQYQALVLPGGPDGN